ncbi:hypothetical protein D3C75_1222470 [compost metagenome]
MILCPLGVPRGSVIQLPVGLQHRLIYSQCLHMQGVDLFQHRQRIKALILHRLDQVPE